MSFGISKTIPAKHDWALEDLFGGKLGEFEFHMAGKPTRLNEGDFVYTIFKDELHGRCRIKRFKGGGGQSQIWSGTDLDFRRDAWREIEEAASDERASGDAVCRRGFLEVGKRTARTGLSCGMH